MKKYVQLIILLIVANSYAQNPVPFDIIYTQEITATKFHLGQRGKVTLEIDDAGRDGLITRPLIVAEGFDPGIILSPEVVGGDMTLSDFQDDVSSTFWAGNLSPLLYGSNRQYDIIYIDWQNGTANINHKSRF